MYYRFHVNLLAAPPADSFATTWEDAARRLEQLPRMIFEPDGSFAISGSSPPPDSLSPNRWQVDGHLFDFADHLYRVELHGDCPRDMFDRLLRCTGWPEQSLVFELVREGVTLDEENFREWIEAT